MQYEYLHFEFCYKSNAFYKLGTFSNSNDKNKVDIYNNNMSNGKILISYQYKFIVHWFILITLL